jgi:hypothetical protein
MAVKCTWGLILNPKPNVQVNTGSCFCNVVTGPYFVPIFIATFLILFKVLRHCILRNYAVNTDTKGIAFTPLWRVIGRLNFDEIDRAYGAEEFRSIHNVAKVRVFGTGNRLRKGAKPIIVRLKQGRMKYWEISTVEPDVFLRKINEHLRSQAFIR